MTSAGMFLAHKQTTFYSIHGAIAINVTDYTISMTEVDTNTYII